MTTSFTSTSERRCFLLARQKRRLLITSAINTGMTGGHSSIFFEKRL